MVYPIGHRHGKLEVVGKGRRPAKSRRCPEPWDTWWCCRCDCGGSIVIHWTNIGKTASCGCGRGTHKMSFHPLYATWVRMKGRCHNPNVDSYVYYGGRGIRVVKKWHEFAPFRDWALANGWRKGLTIDRVNPNGHYGPNNCRWATALQQGSGRRNNVMVTYKGESVPITRAARMAGLSPSAVWARRAAGWPESQWLVPAKYRRGSR